MFFDLFLAFYILALTIQYTKILNHGPDVLFCWISHIFVSSSTIPLWHICKVYKYEYGDVHSSGDLYYIFKAT